MNLNPVSYKRHLFPPSLIAHAVWLYVRFPLSLRLVEEMLLECGIVVSYETIRCRARKFGPDYARRLPRKAPSPDDVWHLDEVVVTIGGSQTLAPARGQSGRLRSRRDRPDAPQHQGCQASANAVDEEARMSAEADRHRQPSLLWRSTAACNAHRRASITQEAEHRAENSHLPLRKRERIMQRFRSPGSLQRFVSVFSAIRNLFVPARSNHSAIAVHLHRLTAIAHWKAVTATAA